MKNKLVYIILAVLCFLASCQLHYSDTHYTLSNHYMFVSDNEPITFDYSPSNPYSSMNDSGTNHFDLNSEGLPVYEDMYPSILGRYGLKLGLQYLKTNDSNTYELLKKTAHKLIAISKDKGTYITWEFPIEYTPFNAPVGWTSGLTNAWAALALLYYGEFTASIDPAESTLYINYAKKALNHIFIPVKDGGAKTILTNGDIWYEEYPSEPSSHVLNGFVYILDVIHVFAYYYPSEYKEILNDGIATVYHHVDKFNKPYTSIYDLYTMGNRIGSAYHTLHFRMISWLYYITGNDHFKRVSEHWFNLNQQSNYTLYSVDSSSNNVTEEMSAINDFTFWYGGYRFKLGSDSIILTLPEKVDLYGINYYLTDNKIDWIPDIEIETDRGWISLDSAKLFQSGANITGKYETYASGVIFPSTFLTQKVKIHFTKLPLEVREIGLLYNQPQKFEEKLNNLAQSYNW